jgi:hypothetical protein
LERYRNDICLYARLMAGSLARLTAGVCEWDAQKHVASYIPTESFAVRPAIAAGCGMRNPHNVRVSLRVKHFGDH